MPSTAGYSPSSPTSGPDGAPVRPPPVRRRKPADGSDVPSGSADIGRPATTGVGHCVDSRAFGRSPGEPSRPGCLQARQPIQRGATACRAAACSRRQSRPNGFKTRPKTRLTCVDAGFGTDFGTYSAGRAGLPAMAQVDLGSRQNRHQPLGDLTRMSSTVLRALGRRVHLPEQEMPGPDAPGGWGLPGRGSTSTRSPHRTGCASMSTSTN
jgi:hypothetical protein